MTNWFTSDLHLGHERIIELCNRPFKDVDEMNGEIIWRWNSVVDPSDRVFVLGDVCMGRIAYTLPLVRTLNGRKYIIPGNHDRCWPHYYSGKSQDYQKRKVIEAAQLYEEFGFVVLPGEIEFQRDWKMCHFPTSGDSQEADRYTEFRPTLTDDQWLVHGHVHNAWKVNGHQINVGVDVWNYYPVHEHTIKSIISRETKTMQA
jgi:calcineurin-like phosphoesterase family protein